MEYGKVLDMESKDIPIIEDIACDLCGRTRKQVAFAVPECCVECWGEFTEFMREIDIKNFGIDAVEEAERNGGA